MAPHARWILSPNPLTPMTKESDALIQAHLSLQKQREVAQAAQDEANRQKDILSERDQELRKCTEELISAAKADEATDAAVAEVTPV
jgi:hypothetical protein